MEEALRNRIENEGNDYSWEEFLFDQHSKTKISEVFLLEMCNREGQTCIFWIQKWKIRKEKKVYNNVANNKYFLFLIKVYNFFFSGGNRMPVLHFREKMEFWWNSWNRLGRQNLGKKEVWIVHFWPSVSRLQTQVIKTTDATSNDIVFLYVV